MRMSWRTARILVVCGLVLMVIGAIDPLEGSLVILPGSALVALGGYFGGDRRRRRLLWAFGLVAAGVGLLFAMSALGGIGGDTGRSLWWALLFLPYPVGWIMGLVGAIQTLRETPQAPGAAPVPTESPQ